MRETKTFPLAELKIAASGEGSGTFEGRASTFGTVDSYGDTIVPGAYQDTIPQFLTRGFIGWGHDWNEPIGYVTSAEERLDGLYIAGTFHSDADAQKFRTRAAERMAAGKFMGLSIGYKSEGWEMRQVDTPVRNQWGEFTDKVRALTKIRLYEVSLVTVPAEENSGLTGIKNTHLADHRGRVLADLVGLKARYESLADSLRKEGRAISSSRRTRMESDEQEMREVAGRIAVVADDIKALLVETAPPEKALDAHVLYAHYLATQARLNGVAV